MMSVSLAEFGSAEPKKFNLFFRQLCRRKNTSRPAECATEGSAWSGRNSSFESPWGFQMIHTTRKNLIRNRAEIT